MDVKLSVKTEFLQFFPHKNYKIMHILHVDLLSYSLHIALSEKLLMLINTL